VKVKVTSVRDILGIKSILIMYRQYRGMN